MIELYDYQLDAIERMHNGCILCGGVGSGKSVTAIGYYLKQNQITINKDSRPPKKGTKLLNLYIITTARKRDSFEWESDLASFLLSPDRDIALYDHTVVIDSWNNIAKYSEIHDAFFIFDEQRVVGYGAWTKTFLQIVKHNQWILLSATPGDTWSDYMPVFIANGYYKHKTDFVSQHVIYRANRNFRQVDRYVNTRKLIRQRDELLITMDFHRQTVHHDEHVLVEYDRILYRDVVKNRWNPYTNKPIKNASELCSVIRKIVNSDPSRLEAALSIARKHDRVIVFYTFDYERDILLSADWGDKTIAEWSGHTHQDIPDTDKWVYLSQYLSGAEGWNCIQTDTIIFYSQSYSYRQTEQAKGRIDRLNTKYIDLWYYYLKSVSPIDTAISVALKSKKKFNEEKFVGKIKF